MTDVQRDETAQLDLLPRAACAPRTRDDAPRAPRAPREPRAERGQAEEPLGPLVLLPLVLCAPRKPRRGGGSVDEEQVGEPLERPLRERALRVLCVLHGLHARDRAATTRVLRHALCLPDTESETRTLERTLVLLQKQRLVTIADYLCEGPGRPSRVWEITPAGRAEMLVEYRQAAIARQRLEVRARRALVRSR